jgi:hypothetical protein
MAFSLSSVVNEEFKMMGLSLKGDAMGAVVSFLERAEDANAALSLMLDALDARSLTSSIVDKQVVDETTRALDRAAGVSRVEVDEQGVPANANGVALRRTTSTTGSRSWMRSTFQSFPTTRKDACSTRRTNKPTSQPSTPKRVRRSICSASGFCCYNKGSLGTGCS